MTRRLALRLLVAVLGLLTAPAVHAADAADAAHCFLWKVKSPTATVWLMGSVHVGDPAIYPLDQAIEKAFAESQALVVELDVLSGDQVRMTQLMQAQGLYPPQGASLRTDLSRETFAALEAFAKKRGQPMQQLEAMRPWLVSLWLTIQEVQQLGYKPELGIDLHFLGQARLRKLPVIELETAEDQIAAMTAGTLSQQDLNLKQTLEQLDNAREWLKKIFALWSAGDADGLDTLLLAPLRENETLKPLYERTFVSRNKKMLEKIQAFLKTDKTCFVVVGAGHLAGKDGLIELLREKKLPVEQALHQGRENR